MIVHLLIRVKVNNYMTCPYLYVNLSLIVFLNCTKKIFLLPTPKPSVGLLVSMWFKPDPRILGGDLVSLNRKDWLDKTVIQETRFTRVVLSIFYGYRIFVPFTDCTDLGTDRF